MAVTPTNDAADLQPEPQPAPTATLTRVRVAFQGEAGAFSEEAVHTLWRGAAEPVPMRTFEDVMFAAETRQVDFGLLPIESTLVGGLDVAYDLLSLHDGLHIVAEVVVPVHLCLLGLPGASVAELREVASHPVMLGTCSYFLQRHKHILAQPAWDTAGAAREVRDAGDPTRAAAGSRRAAERFGLEILKEHIEDRPDTQMRFLAVAPEAVAPKDGVAARTAVLCVFPDSAGALVSALTPLAKAGFNISHLATHPTREPWQYQYFVEFAHPAGDDRATAAVEKFRSVSLEFRYLGTYPRWVVPPDESLRGVPW